MLTFKKIRLKNFQSYGNKISEFEYKNGIDLIIGNNGGGKSSFFIGALFYALFGKSYLRLNLAKLINNLNDKNLWVELEFDVNNIPYRIERGIKPNVFNIFKDNVLIPQSSNTKDYQHFLESNILGFGETTFKSTVAICSVNYVPFLQLTALERRYVLDDVLGLSVFSRMNEALKKENMEVENELYLSKKKKNDLDVDIKIKSEVGKNKKELIEKNIRSIQVEIVEIIKEHVPPLVKKYKELDVKINSTNIDEYKKLYLSTQQVLKDIEEKISIIKYEVKRLQKEEQFFTSGEKICTQCYQEISEQHINESLKKINDLKKEYKKEYDKYISLKDSNESEIQKYKSVIKQHESDKQNFEDLKDKIKFYKKEIEKKEKNIETQTQELHKEEVNIQSDIDNLLDSVNEVVRMIEEIQFTLENNNHIFTMFKDDGIKLFIIKTIIPTFNSLIKDFEDMIESEFHLEFDENFNEKIYNQNNEVVEFNSLSTGEKSIINLLLIFTFREFAKLRSGLNTNLLIFDEFTEGVLSAENMDLYIKIISNMRNYNIQIISHSPENYENIYSRKISMNKVENFSELKIEA